MTNQPQISMGKLSLELLENINNHVMLHCRDKGLLIDTVIWCPHHPHKGFSSEVEYLKDCFLPKTKSWNVNRNEFPKKYRS